VEVVGNVVIPNSYDPVRPTWTIPASNICVNGRQQKPPAGEGSGLDGS
jgi:hypothetical protein